MCPLGVWTPARVALYTRSSSGSTQVDEGGWEANAPTVVRGSVNTWSVRRECHQLKWHGSVQLHTSLALGTWPSPRLQVGGAEVGGRVPRPPPGDSPRMIVFSCTCECRRTIC
jgi:hypothetical protein